MENPLIVVILLATNLGVYHAYQIEYYLSNRVVSSRELSENLVYFHKESL